jgi:hypothetical protein
MNATRYIASVTVCAVLYAGFFLLLDTSFHVRSRLAGAQGLVVGVLVGVVPAVLCAAAFAKEFELERFVGRVAILAGLGAGIGWLAARGLMVISVCMQ